MSHATVLEKFSEGRMNGSQKARAKVSGHCFSEPGSCHEQEEIRS